MIEIPHLSTGPSTGSPLPFFLRLITETDAPALASIYRPYVEQTAITFEYEAPDSAEFVHRIRGTLPNYPYLAAQSTAPESYGQLIGYCYASPFKERAAYIHAAESSIYIKQDQRQSGVGRALYQSLECLLKAQGICTLYACLAYDSCGDDPYLNNGSLYFHQKQGYQQCAHFKACGYKFGRWYDMIWLEKELLALPGQGLEPPPFVPFAALRQDTQLLRKAGLEL